MADSGINTMPVLRAVGFPQPPLSAPSALLPEPTLPTYSDVQQAAVETHLRSTQNLRGTWITVRCPDVCYNSFNVELERR